MVVMSVSKNEMYFVGFRVNVSVDEVNTYQEDVVKAENEKDGTPVVVVFKMLVIVVVAVSDVTDGLV